MHRNTFTISNVLSLARIGLAPLVAGVIIFYPQCIFIGLVLFTLAMITDFFDGYLARKYNHQTALGAFLDPLADKCLVLGTFAAFYIQGKVPFWILLIIAGRDLFVTLLRLVMAQRGKNLVTSRSAKWKTTSQFITIYVLFFTTYGTNTVFHILVDATLYGCTLFTVWTGISYLF